MRAGAKLTERGVGQPVVHDGHLLYWYSLAMQGVLGDGAGIRDEQVGRAGREAFHREQEPLVLLEHAQAAAAGHEHRNSCHPGGRGGNEVAVQKESVQYVRALPAEAADEAAEGRGIPQHVLCRPEAAEAQVDNGNARLAECAFVRPAFEHDQHADVDSALREPLGEQDDLLLGSAQAKLPDHQAHLAGPRRRAGLGRR